MKNSFGSLLFVLSVGVAGTACMASGSAQYSASATMPSMVVVSPGVQVIEDYDEPIFYSSNFYWHNDGGVWYQSHSYTGGWVRVTAAPAAIVRIQQPSMYVHYHASAQAGAQANGNAQTEHREAQEERREEKHEAQQERHEEKQERHDDDHDNGHKGHKK